YATGASVHEATGAAVAVGFSAGNLRPVAEELRAKFPALHIVIAGDNDKNGTGQRAALEAARTIGALVAIPTTEGRDWNEVHQVEGLGAVRAGIEAAREPDGDPRTEEGAHLSHEGGDTAVCRTSRTVAAGPTPLLRSIPPPDPFPIDALGAILGPAARAIAEVVQCPA
ncbi:DNA primase domain protein, partial [mine drainage metagenome]